MASSELFKVILVQETSVLRWTNIFGPLTVTCMSVCKHRYEMDSLAFEKFQNAVFFKIFKFPFNEQLEMV